MLTQKTIQNLIFHGFSKLLRVDKTENLPIKISLNYREDSKMWLFLPPDKLKSFKAEKNFISEQDKERKIPKNEIFRTCTSKEIVLFIHFLHNKIFIPLLQSEYQVTYKH